MPEADDLQRLRWEYSDRGRRLAGSDVYSPFNPANLFIVQQRQREVLKLLRRQGFFPLTGRNILELGCGEGGVLLEYLSYGAEPSHLHGVELLPDRVQTAHQLLPHLPLVCGDGQRLPYLAEVFDLVLQYTVFTSVLDSQVKSHLAQEMVRVLKPGGMVVWYDFWLNPANRQTRGIRLLEIRRLFPNCEYHVQRITLAPPLTRRLVRISWFACAILETMRLFNSHYLVGIIKK